MNDTFPRRTLEELLKQRSRPVAPDALEAVTQIIADVEAWGEEKVRYYAETFGEVERGGPLFHTRAELAAAWEGLPRPDRDRLTRVASRIGAFANAQRAALTDVRVPIPGGNAGHVIVPVERVGCYAPGGRYPLPSSVLMTAVTARAAGVSDVWVASPRPQPITLAAAYVAEVDGVLAVGGAHGIAALAFGLGSMAPRDVIVGPGNKYVTAAKHVIAGRASIDLLAGPTELVVVADDSADPATVAADLVAQAEHDPEAVPVLISVHAPLADAVTRAVEQQLSDLPTAGTARNALQRGGLIVTATREEAFAAANALAAEHLHLCVRNPSQAARQVEHCGAVFYGSEAPVVLGDYGVGPNHTLPTGGSARSQAGLSVYAFLRPRTWIQIDDPEAARGPMEDAAWFGHVEGLVGHARAAQMRLPAPVPARDDDSGSGDG